MLKHVLVMQVPGWGACLILLGKNMQQYNKMLYPFEGPMD